MTSKPTSKLLKVLAAALTVLCVALSTIAVDAQALPAAPDAVPAAPADALGRTNPQDSMFQFLQACHSRDYSKAALYLDMKRLTNAQRAKEGPELARQLEDLLDDTTFDLRRLSRQPEGKPVEGQAADQQLLASLSADGQTIKLYLERSELKSGLFIWLVSPDSVTLIPKAHQLFVTETPFEKKLPQGLVTFEIFDTPAWRWIALIVMGTAIWFVAGWLARGMVLVMRPLLNAPAFRVPLRFWLTTLGIRLAIEIAPPAAVSRLYIERMLGLAFLLALAGACAVVVDLLAEHWRVHLDPRQQAVSYSVLPLVRQILKLSLYLFAILTAMSFWGYNTSTILAGLGVGGLAVALAAQKTIENLFGGISVIGDRPVLIGDVCRFGDHTGTVMHIGLRSTRIRTAERTVISIPNGQFSSMALENISGRDKILFNPKLSLRIDTTSEQLQKVLKSFGEILASTPKVEPAKIPVRFIGVGAYSLDVEIATYIVTQDGDEFLQLQQDLLLKLLQAVEQAGTALAVPLQERVDRKPQTQA